MKKLSMSSPQLSQSQLEIIDVATGTRKLIHSEKALFEAPNWSRDGKFLIYNQDGLLKRFTLETSAIETIDSDFANRNNNDHGISPDGKSIVISHHAESHNDASIIYTLPIEGGIPTIITNKGPSYWHGWSPDGTTLAYVAGRPSHKAYNIYTIPVAGGVETQITDGDYLDDGPDYSHDGRYIYFNSFRSGMMQIWRMDADGKNAIQVVESAHSDWFPHPSPDGKYLVFIRYLKDQVQAHPFGQDVQLMLLNLETNILSELTDVFYGGQGSLNVPSWNPQSSQLAFVTYTK